MKSIIYRTCYIYYDGMYVELQIIHFVLQRGNVYLQVNNMHFIKCFAILDLRQNVRYPFLNRSVKSSNGKVDYRTDQSDQHLDCSLHR